MKVELGAIAEGASRWLPENEPDASGVGVNYASAVVQKIKATLPDGRKVRCKRRGLKITFQIGDRAGEAFLRRVDHGPDVRRILEVALTEAAQAAGASFALDGGVMTLDVHDSDDG